MIYVRKIAVIATALALWGGALGCRTPSAALELTRYEYTQPQMGVPLRLVLYAESQAQADMAAAAALARVSELNAALSDYEDESEITRLSKSDFWPAVGNSP